MTDLHYLTLTDVADRIADGSLTSLEVTEAILARITLFQGGDRLTGGLLQCPLCEETPMFYPRWQLC